MKYYVSANAQRNGDGSEKRPFQTITAASKLARAGDEVIVAPGIYREYVDPIYGGCEDAPIVYRSEVPLAAVITGAEVVKNWEKYEGDVWMVRISNGLFGSYNPYNTVIAVVWYNASVPVHTGEVYLNGKSM